MPPPMPANMMADCITLRTLRDARKEYSAGFFGGGPRGGRGVGVGQLVGLGWGWGGEGEAGKEYSAGGGAGAGAGRVTWVSSWWGGVGLGLGWRWGDG
jgi:hypothetical protein